MTGRACSQVITPFGRPIFPLHLATLALGGVVQQRTLDPIGEFSSVRVALLPDASRRAVPSSLLRAMGAASKPMQVARCEHEIGKRLLEYLRSTLGDDATLDYAEPPARIVGGYDTAIYALRLTAAPGEFGSPVDLARFPATTLSLFGRDRTRGAEWRRPTASQVRDSVRAGREARTPRPCGQRI